MAPRGTLSMDAPPGTFANDTCAPPETDPASASTAPKRPPGCWGAGEVASTLLSRSAVSTEKGQTRRMNKSARQIEVERTTVMLRNLPSFFTRDMLLALLNSL